MKKLVLIACFLATGCQPNEPAEPTPDSGLALTTPEAPPKPVVHTPVRLSEVLGDIDQITIAERTLQAVGDQPASAMQHPQAYVSTDPAWIAGFIRALGPGVKPSAGPDAPCILWADVMFERRGATVFSAALGCSPGQVERLQPMGDSIYKVRSSDAAMKQIAQLRTAPEL